MLLEVIRFELRYRLNRPATYIYFFVWMLLAFAAVSIEGVQLGDDIGNIKQNASSVLFSMSAFMSLLPGMFIASAIMGVPVLRDIEHKTDSLMFTTNMSKGSYLFGRFIGSFFILLFISTAFIFGITLGSIMPWVDQDRFLKGVGLIQYLRPWLYIIVPNMLFLSAVFFASGALLRKMLFVYLQSMLLLALYILLNALTGDAENQTMTAISDPFGLQTFSVYTRYWTVAQKNSTPVPLEGILLTNRLLWLGVSLIILIITYLLFKFQTVPSGIFKARRRKEETTRINAETGIPVARATFNTGTWLRQVTTLTKLYSKETIRSIPFLGMALIGIILLLTTTSAATNNFGQHVHAVSSGTASFIASQSLIIALAMILFYCGDLLWKEKDIKFDQIFDALPMGNSVPVVSKLLALANVLLAYIAVLLPIGILIQLFNGNTHIQLDVYLQVLLLRIFVPMFVFMTFLLFFQAISSNKFVGYALSMLLYIYILFSDQLHIYHNLLVPNSGGLQVYSDMNGFAAEIGQYVVLKMFWLSIGLVLLAVAVLMYQRGTSADYGERLKRARQKLNAPLLGTLSLGLVLTIVFGGCYYYNRNVLNKYTNTQLDLDNQAAYEKKLRKTWYRKPQPSVSDVTGKVDLYPEKGRLDMDVVMTFKNLMNTPIQQIFLQMPPDDLLHYKDVKFSVPATLKENYPVFHVGIYQLSKPLNPGDSFTLHLTGSRQRKGFIEDDVSFVNNGTFINNGNFLPSAGYNPNGEIDDKDDRKKRGLKEKDGLSPRTDTIATQYNLFATRGRINLDLTIGTDGDQVAICPGYLQKEWKENGRAYFHYKMDKPIVNFFNIISGRYLVKREKWHDVSLEIYYHKDHTYNIDEMMQAMKDALTYYSKEFSPFSYHQMRIIEFPKYRSFAQSFSNTVPFSEGLGFILKKEKDKLDLGYYITGHELGHQWWGHQVTEADAQGNQMFSESLAQYSAMMLMKKKLPREQLSRYVKYEMDDYLAGRSVEKKKENPLDHVDGQQYIYYNKGSVAFFALQDYIGEDSVNSALRRLIANYGDKNIYPTTDVLTGYFKQVTPDSMKFIVDDLFSKITLFDNRVVKPTATQTKGGYLVHIPVNSAKYYADSAGNEKKTPLHDYIDIGIFAKGTDGKDKLLYLKREKITKERNIYSVVVKEKPSKAGIDPLYKLIDRDTKDNLETVEVN